MARSSRSLWVPGRSNSCHRSVRPCINRPSQHVYVVAITQKQKRFLPAVLRSCCGPGAVGLSTYTHSQLIFCSAALCTDDPSAVFIETYLILKCVFLKYHITKIVFNTKIQSILNLVRFKMHFFYKSIDVIMIQGQHQATLHNTPVEM